MERTLEGLFDPGDPTGMSERLLKAAQIVEDAAYDLAMTADKAFCSRLIALSAELARLSMDDEVRGPGARKLTLRHIC